MAELLGPINMQLRRTKLALNRWNTQNLYLEMKVMREGNQKIRDLLLTKTYLIPPDLLDCATQLVEHYDVWLEEFEMKRLAEIPDLKTKFIFAADRGYPFPKECDTKFRKRYDEIWTQVYGG